MSLNLKYNQMRENDPTNRPGHSQDEPNGKDGFYPTHSHVRNICFVMLDGSKLFLNYSYLVSGLYRPADNSIVLAFTTHAITMTGIRLETLFSELIDHLPKTITCLDERYNILDETDKPIVNTIEVRTNNE